MAFDLIDVLYEALKTTDISDIVSNIQSTIDKLIPQALSESTQSSATNLQELVNAINSCISKLNEAQAFLTAYREGYNTLLDNHLAETRQKARSQSLSQLKNEKEEWTWEIQKRKAQIALITGYSLVSKISSQFNGGEEVGYTIILGGKELVEVTLTLDQILSLSNFQFSSAGIALTLNATGNQIKNFVKDLDNDNNKKRKNMLEKMKEVQLEDGNRAMKKIEMNSTQQKVWERLQIIREKMLGTYNFNQGQLSEAFMQYYRNYANYSGQEDNDDFYYDILMKARNTEAYWTGGDIGLEQIKALIYNPNTSTEKRNGGRTHADIATFSNVTQPLIDISEKIQTFITSASGGTLGQVLAQKFKQSGKSVNPGTMEIYIRNMIQEAILNI